MSLLRNASRVEARQAIPRPHRVASGAFAWVPHFFPQIWWLLVLVTGLGLYVAQDLGYLPLLFRLDRSRVSWVIAALVLGGTCHVAWHLLVYSARLSAGQQWLLAIPAGGGPSVAPPETTSATTAQAQAFLRAWLADTTVEHGGRRLPEPVDEHTSTPQEQLSEIYADRLRSPVEVGWFVVDLAIRLGLLGTIIGFILIFTSLSSVSIEGSDGLRELLVAMSAGMGTALFTTLAGLVGATLLSVQYLILGRAAEHLLAVLLRLREAQMRTHLPAH